MPNKLKTSADVRDRRLYVLRTLTNQLQAVERLQRTLAELAAFDATATDAKATANTAVEACDSLTDKLVDAIAKQAKA